MSNVSSVNAISKNAEFNLYVNNLLTATYEYDAVSNIMSFSDIGTNVLLPLAEWQVDQTAFTTWINLITLTFSPVIVVPTSTTEDFIRSITDYRGNFTISGNVADIRYTFATKQITLVNRLAFNLTWGEFVTFNNFNVDFLVKVLSL
jgi:hypothetical protein